MRTVRLAMFATLALALIGSVAIEKSAASERELTISTMQSGDPPPACQPHVKCPPKKKISK
jgi:hypothetical protein